MARDPSFTPDIEPQALAEAIADILWIARADGTLQYVNRRAVEFAGSPLGVADVRAFQGFLHPDDLADAAAAWQHSVGSGAPFEAEVRLRRSDGAYRWMRAKATAILDPDGKVHCWVGTLTDVDDLRRIAEGSPSPNGRPPRR